MTPMLDARDAQMKLKTPDPQGFMEWLKRERETEAEIGTETCPTMHQGQVCWELSMVAIDGLSSAEKGVGHGD